MTTLNNANLDSLSEKVSTPSYTRKSSTNQIVHMSLGGFHRAHHAYYIDQLAEHHDSDWNIVAVGMLPHDEKNLADLDAQDNLYTLLARSADSEDVRIVGSIQRTIFAPSNSQELIDTLASPETKIVSLTVTEKGYHYDNDRNLKLDLPAVAHDLQNPNSPQTIYGYLAAALAKRKAAGQIPFTIMSMDNLPGNGHLTQHLVGQFITAADPDLAAWVADNVSFPNSMVDRITPVPSEATKKYVAEDLEIDDTSPVMCEDFVQWVLEDNFSDGRPAYEKMGIHIVEDVDPYEKMKVRLLNGSHSALAYLSYLMGHRDVDKAMEDPTIASFVEQYMTNDIEPSVPHVPGIDLADYKKSLSVRFSNPAISDQIQRLAEDGSTKIANAITPCIEYALANGNTIAHACMALAGWFRYLQGTDEDGSPIEMNDPIIEQLTKAVASDMTSVKPMLEIAQIFGTVLPNNATFVQALQDAYDSVNKVGARKAVEELVG